MSWLRTSLLMNVTCVPAAICRFLGSTPLAVMVTVVPATGGDGEVVVPPSLPHEIANTTNGKSSLRARITIQSI